MAKGKDKGIGLEAAKRSRPTGANYLLAIAINEYQHHPKLSNCVRDAEQLISILQEKYGFQPDHTVTLFDQEATAANMYTRLVEISRKVKSQDNVVIYFSGHGFYDRSDRTGHLVPVEAQEGAVWHYFSNANLVNRIRAINSFHTFLIVDSCFSGSLFASKDATAFAEVAEGLPSRWALAAGQIETVEDGLHGDHSPFAKALLSYLEANNSPLAPASELIQHVKRVTSHNARQTPVGGVLFKTGDLGGEFVFRLKQDEATAWAEAQQANTLKDMVFIEGGSFEMGDTFGDGGSDEQPVHTVKISDFYLGAFAVTFEEYDAFCVATKRNWSSDNGWGRGHRPVINVNWYDALEYCNWRSKQEGLEPCFQRKKEMIEEKSFFGLIKGQKEIEKNYCDFSLNGYRLPTEAEWEYAARQRGQKVRFGNGKDIVDPEEINFNGSAQYKKPYSKEGVYRLKTKEVGSFAPNSLGLYDMSGNVWEWCWDWGGGEYYKKSNNAQDPKGPDSGSSRVFRGGSWDYSPPAVARCAERYYVSPDFRYYSLGFRLARTVR